jgi:hypothetical protein
MGGKHRPGQFKQQARFVGAPSFAPPAHAEWLMSATSGRLSYYGSTCPNCGERHPLGECPYWRPAA